MNHLIAAALLTATLTSATPAKDPGDTYSKAIQVRATTLTQALAHRIHFNEGQYVRIKHLHLEYLTERHTLELELAGDSQEVRDTKLAAAQQRYEQNLNDLLHPDQRIAYQQLRANFTAHRL